MENIIIIGAGPPDLGSTLCGKGKYGSADYKYRDRFTGKSREDRELLRTGAAIVRQRAF